MRNNSGGPDVLYVFAGGMFNKKLETDFHTTDLWKDSLNKLDPIIVIPTYHELDHGVKYFHKTFAGLLNNAILTNGYYNSSTKTKTPIDFLKYRIKKIRGRNILFLGVVCPPKIKGNWSKHLNLSLVIESIK